MDWKTIFGGLVVVVLILIPFLLSQGFNPDFFEETTDYKLSIWTQPTNTTYHLAVDIYLSDPGLGDATKHCGFMYKIDPEDDVYQFFRIEQVPSDLSTFWLHVYIAGTAGTVIDIRAGQKETLHLSGHTVEVLMESWV